jgi:uncharacterized protein (TIGR03085 family)
MPSHSAAERAALADALIQAGPEHPTLCDGWDTPQLAAHLVIREGRPDSALGIMLPPFAGWTARVLAGYARRPYAGLVATFRDGPPRLSPFAIPGVDARVNLAEHFVHCEDVRRARPGWEPRLLPDGRQEALWSALTSTGRMLLRRSPVTVTLRRPDGAEVTVVRKGDGEGIALTGEPGELLLYTFGRKDQAVVQLEGPDAEVSTFRNLSLGF